MTGLVLGLVIGVGAFAASGVGHLLLAGASAGTRLRTVLAECLVGFLAYTSLFGVLAHLRLPFNLAVVTLLGFAAIGLWARLRREPRLGLLAAAAVAFSVALAVSLTPVNPNALDPTTYAFMASTVFQERWLTDTLTSLPEGEWLRSTADEGVLTRAPSLALVWPAAALGWGVTARTVAGVAAWFLLPMFAALTDVLHGYAVLPLRLLVAAGAIGVYNEMAVLVDAQVNQTFALAAVVGTAWACRWIRNRRAERVFFVLAGAVVSAGYPEFLAAMPLYLVCCAWFGDRSVRSLVTDGLGLAAGWGLVQLTTGSRNARFLFEEAAANPTWWPLPSDPANPGEVWLDVLVQRPPPVLLALLLLPISWYVWRTTRCAVLGPCLPPRQLAWLSLAVLGGLGVVWTWLVVHGPNPNYATFKLGGWLGPGLFLLAFLLIGLARPPARNALATVLIVLAAARVLGLVTDTPPKLVQYATFAPSPPSWSMTQSALACELSLASPDRRQEMAALAASAAPVRACTAVSQARPR